MSRRRFREYEHKKVRNKPIELVTKLQLNLLVSANQNTNQYLNDNYEIEFFNTSRNTFLLQRQNMSLKTKNYTI